MVIMGEEPLKGISPAEFQKMVEPITTTQALADAFAGASNEFWWVEDNEYDFEEGTPEYEQATALTDAWHSLLEKYEEQIFNILRSEGIEIPSAGQIVVLAPFMERYGYIDGGGWWIRSEDQECASSDKDKMYIFNEEGQPTELLEFKDD